MRQAPRLVVERIPGVERPRQVRHQVVEQVRAEPHRVRRATERALAHVSDRERQADRRRSREQGSGHSQPPAPGAGLPRHEQDQRQQQHALLGQQRREQQQRREPSCRGRASLHQQQGRRRESESQQLADPDRLLQHAEHRDRRAEQPGGERRRKRRCAPAPRERIEQGDVGRVERRVQEVVGARIRAEDPERGSEVEPPRQEPPGSEVRRGQEPARPFQRDQVVGMEVDPERAPLDPERQGGAAEREQHVDRARRSAAARGGAGSPGHSAGFLMGAVAVRGVGPRPDGGSIGHPGAPRPLLGTRARQPGSPPGPPPSARVAATPSSAPRRPSSTPRAPGRGGCRRGSPW